MNVTGSHLGPNPVLHVGKPVLRNLSLTGLHNTASPWVKKPDSQIFTHMNKPVTYINISVIWPVHIYGPVVTLGNYLRQQSLHLAFVECNIQYVYAYPTLPQLNLFLLNKHHFRMEGTDSIQVNNERDFFFVLLLLSLLHFIIRITRGIFVTERAWAPFRNFLLTRIQAEMAFQNFPGIGIINTPTSQTKFWVTHAFWNLLFSFLRNSNEHYYSNEQHEQGRWSRS
jgi:hypothetical protein